MAHTRRGFLSAFVMASAAAVPVAARQRDTLLASEMAGAPICPKCGLHVPYQQRAYESVVDVPEPVRCDPCGWAGKHVRIRSVQR